MVVMGTLALGFLYFHSFLLLILNIVFCGLDLVESKLASHLLYFLFKLINDSFFIHLFIRSCTEYI